MGRHLVLVGAGHAHLMTLQHLHHFIRKKFKVTVINPDVYHYYSGMAPGMLSGIYRPQDLRFNVKKLTSSQKGRFIQDRVTVIDPLKKKLVLENGKEISYDVVSFNTGSVVTKGPFLKKDSRVFSVKPIENIFHARKAITESAKKGPLQILTAGAGPSGVEIACNLWRLSKIENIEISISIISSGPVLESFPDKIRSLARQSMQSRGIKIIENCAIESITKKGASLCSGEIMPFDFAFNATGIEPTDIFKKSGFMTGPDGELVVNEYLQSTDYPEIFGGGDCIFYKPIPVKKAELYAIRQNQVLRCNLESALEQDIMEVFLPQQKHFLILNLGNDEGLFYRPPFSLKGKWAFCLKNYIDQRFIKQYQKMGERGEPLGIR